MKHHLKIVAMILAFTLACLPGAWADPITPPQIGNGGLSGTVSVTTSSGVLLARTTSAYRSRVILVNLDPTNPIYVAYRTATTTDLRVLPGQSLTLNTAATLYAIATGGTVSVSYITEEIQ